MIVIRVELYSAITGKVTEIARAVISNIGGDAKRGNYHCRAYRKGSDLHPLDTGVIRSGSIEKHLRLQKPVWNLVYKALGSMGYAK